LVDAVTADANNPMGGNTLSMAQGGAVVDTSPAYVFANGGSSRIGSRAQIVPGLSDGVVDPMAAKNLRSRQEMTAGELTNAMFPYEAGLTGGFLGPQKSRPGPLGLGQEPGPSRPIVDALRLPFDFLDQSARGLSQVNATLGRVLFDFGQAALSTKPEETDYTNFYGQIRAVNDALRRGPSIQGVSAGDVGSNISNIAKSLIGEDPNITGEKLSQAIAQGIYTKYEQPFVDDLDAADAADAAAGAGSVGDGGAETLAGMGAVGDGNAAAFLEEQDTLAGMGAVGGGNPETDVVTPAVTVPGPTNTGPTAVPGKDVSTDGQDVSTDGQDVSTDGQAVSTAVEQAASILDTDEKADGKTIDDFKKKFMEAMPKYEGVSEEEKGFAILDAGLRIMAGKSSNAITNIAKGLQGLGPELAKGAKEKREWNRQVELSAAKYALTGMEKLRTEERALAAEGRKRPFELIATKDFTMDGVKIERGTAVPLTNQQITDGYLNRFPLTYRETFVSDAKATANLAELANKDLIKPNLFSADRKVYLENARSVKNGIRMKGLLMEAAKIAIPEGAEDSQVLGVVPLFKSWVNKGLNAAGYQDTVEGRQKLTTFRSTKPEEYRVLMKTIGTTMVTEILNESNKTISEGDRARVDDLVAAYSDFDGTVASYKSLLLKLNNLEKTIDAGIEGASKSMKGIETNWGKSEFIGGGTAAGTLSSIRNFSGRPASYSVGDLRSTSIPYKDIINMETRKFTPKYQNIFGKKVSK